MTCRRPGLDIRNGHHGRAGDVGKKVFDEYVRRLDLVVFSGNGQCRLGDPVSAGGDVLGDSREDLGERVEPEGGAGEVGASA
jgi:hypothetical protein